MLRRRSVRASRTGCGRTQGAGGFLDGETARATLVLLALPLLLSATRPTRSILGTIGAFLALSVGWSRILLGESWPSDVIAGWGFALLWVMPPLRLAGFDIGDGAPRTRSAAPEQQHQVVGGHRDDLAEH